MKYLGTKMFISIEPGNQEKKKKILRENLVRYEKGVTISVFFLKIRNKVLFPY